MMPSGRESLEKCRRKKNNNSQIGEHSDRQTGRAIERQTDSKNKILEENQSSTPSWASLLIGYHGDQLESRGGALPVRWRGGLPCGLVCVCACVCLCAVSSVKTCSFAIMFFCIVVAHVHTCTYGTTYSCMCLIQVQYASSVSFMYV